MQPSEESKSHSQVLIEMVVKDFIRQALVFFHLDLTKNLEYDRLTKKILESKINENSNCIDVGCHKGEILDIILKQSPKGTHYGFEPIPSFFSELSEKYAGKATILPYALSEENGTSSFNFVKNAPAYSGIKKRAYKVDPEIEVIDVELKKLDDIIPSSLHVDLIKIDVEGAEFSVLKGAKETIQRCRPTIIFEFGKGASEYYGTDPGELFDFLSEAGLSVFTLKDFGSPNSLKRSIFVKHYEMNDEYYFVAN